MSYTEHFIAVVPSAYRKQYDEYYHQVTPVFKQHGALNITHVWQGEFGEIDSSLATAVNCSDDEVAMCRTLTWPSREARDQGIGLCRNDPRMNPQSPSIPMRLKQEMLGETRQYEKCEIIPIPTKLMSAG